MTHPTDLPPKARAFRTILRTPTGEVLLVSTWEEEADFPAFLRRLPLLDSPGFTVEVYASGASALDLVSGRTTPMAVAAMGWWAWGPGSERWEWRS